MSELIDEPGITIPFILGEHVLSRLPIRLFHNNDTLNTKFCFEVDKCILGKDNKNLVSLELSVIRLNIDMGV